MKKFDLKFNLKCCTFFIFICLALWLAILQGKKSQGESSAATKLSEFNRDPQNYNLKLFIIDAGQNKIAEFLAAVADSEDKKMYGLMNLDKLAQNHAMLFTFTKSQIVTMWMKNTRIPLDMIFIDENNLILSIKTNAKPDSTDLISSGQKINKVLEINAGLVKNLQIKVGQKVKFFKNENLPAAK
jgi:uncharacterized membrane protein (UPF0127 family)